MIPQDRNEAIAKWMGLQMHRENGVLLYHVWGDNFDPVPDYVNDLNAMHEVEARLKADGSGAWMDYLRRLGYGDPMNYGKMWALVHATAAQRAEALLRTLNLWEWK